MATSRRSIICFRGAAKFSPALVVVVTIAKSTRCLSSKTNTMNTEALIVAGEASESDEELYSPVPSRYAKYKY